MADDRDRFCINVKGPSRNKPGVGLGIHETLTLSGYWLKINLSREWKRRLFVDLFSYFIVQYSIFAEII
jgi:hypothetical protein